jgi:hypothetical protein
MVFQIKLFFKRPVFKLCGNIQQILLQIRKCEQEPLSDEEFIKACFQKLIFLLK